MLSSQKKKKKKKKFKIFFSIHTYIHINIHKIMVLMISSVFIHTYIPWNNAVRPQALPSLCPAAAAARMRSTAACRVLATGCCARASRYCRVVLEELRAGPTAKNSCFFS